MIHADFDLTFLKEKEGVVKLKETTEGVTLQVESEQAAESVFHEVVQRASFVNSN